MTDPMAALLLLRQRGFGGCRIFGSGGQTMTLHYRRAWRGVADVVLVFAGDDAEAYRADDDRNPFELATQPDLREEVVGTVSEVVAISSG